MALRTSIGWLEPLLPESVPQHVQEKSERLQCDAFRLRALLASETAECVRHLMRAANSFYSNLIEGEYAEPLALVASAAKREKIVQVAPACKHMGAQLVFERALRRYQAMPWEVLFSPEFV